MPRPALAITVGGGDGRSIIALNTNPTLNAFNYRGRSGQLTATEGLAAIIIHELGHLVSQQFGQSASQILDDHDSEAISRGNQVNVEQKCFPNR
jgi:hypothetical protein